MNKLKYTFLTLFISTSLIYAQADAPQKEVTDSVASFTVTIDSKGIQTAEGKVSYEFFRTRKEFPDVMWEQKKVSFALVKSDSVTIKIIKYHDKSEYLMYKSYCARGYYDITDNHKKRFEPDTYYYTIRIGKSTYTKELMISK